MAKAPTIAELLADLPISILRTVHRHAFGAETKMRDRGKVARKIANAIDEKPALAGKVRNAIAVSTEHAAPPPAVRAAVERFRAAIPEGTTVTVSAGGKSATLAGGKKGKPKPAKKGNGKPRSVGRAVDAALSDVKKGTTAKRISAAVRALEPDKARSLLSEVGSSFLEEERLREEKKAERKEIKERIDEGRGEIAGKVKGAADDDDPAKTLREVERIWTAIGADESELAEVTKDYTGRINKARDRIRSTLDNLRQEKLPGIE
jgi:hypothetical protein